MAESKIEWTDKTWNPLAGCTRASAGGDKCYAAGMALRLEAMALADIAAGKDPGAKGKYIGISTRTANGPAFNGVINLDWEAVQLPKSWKKPQMVFVNSMSDLFHKDVPDDFIHKVFWMMLDTPRHTYQVLTKRAERMRYFVQDNYPNLANHRHIWLGVSAEQQGSLDARAGHLMYTPAALRFLSCEPLLGALDASGHLSTNGFDGIGWIIVGGESGPGARPMNPGWVRSLRDQCVSAGVPFFFKQWGEWAPTGGHSLLYSQDEPVDWNLRTYHRPTEELTGKFEHHTFDADKPYFQSVTRFGKAKAGRLLDGRVWDQFPGSEKSENDRDSTQ